ncbi:MAG: polysaccharide biosynthesis protein [Balneolaceae bacterium]|nr:MAG: polysaccharide biosynthesis protein [Balneolaceae bacterium]
MGLILRQSFANTIYSYIGALIGFVNVIWLFPYVLEAEQFGLTRVMISIGIVGAQVASLGMGNVTIRFFPLFRNPGRRHFGFLFFAVTVPLAGYLLLSLLGWIFQSPLIQFYADDSALFGDYYLLLFPLLFFILYFHILESYIRSLFDTVAATFFQDILLRLFQTAVVLIYYFGWIPFGMFMWMFVGTFGLQALLMLLYIGFKKQLFFIPDFTILTLPRIKSMADYAAYAFLGSVTAMTLGNIDMLMVGGMTNLAETAVYAVSLYLATMIKIPSKALIKISQPLIAEAQYKKDLNTISEIYTKSSINQMLVGGVIFIIIGVNLDHVYQFLPAEYHAGAYVFLFIGLAKMIDMTAGLNAAIIRTSSWYRFDLYATLLLVVLTIATNLIFIPIFGITGAAMATALSVLVHNVVYVIYVQVRLGIHPFSKKNLTGIAVLITALLVAWGIPEFPVWGIDLIFRAAVGVAIVTVGIFVLDLSEDLQNFIRQSAASLIRRKRD